MKKKNITVASILIVTILAITISAGLTATKNNRNQKNNISIEDNQTIPTSAEAAKEDVANEESADYKIILDGTRLMLFFREELINEATVTPEVLPTADVKALSRGIAYKTEEKALVDWESLCK